MAFWGRLVSAEIKPFRPKIKCPECKCESARKTYPFCSVRCKEIDLNRWLSGSYVMPRPLVPDEDDYEMVEFKPEVKD